VYYIERGCLFFECIFFFFFRFDFALFVLSTRKKNNSCWSKLEITVHIVDKELSQASVVGSFFFFFSQVFFAYFFPILRKISKQCQVVDRIVRVNVAMEQISVIIIIASKESSILMP
jgi:hypothetical protein